MCFPMPSQEGGVNMFAVMLFCMLFIVIQAALNQPPLPPAFWLKHEMLGSASPGVEKCCGCLHAAVACCCCGVVVFS